MTNLLFLQDWRMSRAYCILLICSVLLSGRTITANPFQSTYEESFYDALKAGNRLVEEKSFAEVLKTPKKFQYLDEYRKEAKGCLASMVFWEWSA